MSLRKSLLLELLRETVWIGIAILIALLIMRPIMVRMEYRFACINALLIILPILYFRYALYIRTMEILRSRWLRFGWCVVNINLFVYVLRRQQEFMGVYDSFTISDMGRPYHPLPIGVDGELFQYFFNEITIAVVATLTLIVVLTLRMIWSYWQSARVRLNAGNEE